MPDTPERRLSARVPLEVPVDYHRLNEFISDYTHNLSRGGTFIRTEQPSPVGTQLTFRLRVPGLNEPLVLHGIVRRVVSVDESSKNHPAGMGIAFLYDSPEEEHALAARVEHLILSSLGQAAYEKLMRKTPPKPH